METWISDSVAWPGGGLVPVIPPQAGGAASLSALGATLIGLDFFTFTCNFFFLIFLFVWGHCLGFGVFTSVMHSLQ